MVTLFWPSTLMPKPRELLTRRAVCVTSAGGAPCGSRDHVARSSSSTVVSMGGQLNKTPRATIQIDPHSEQARRDTALSERPLYVLYGHPADADSARAAQVLERAQVHHCKIGTELLAEALRGCAISDGGAFPRVFECPCAEMLAQEAGSTPGALGATAHGAVARGMCRHIGGAAALEREVLPS